MALQFLWRKNFLLHRAYLLQTLHILNYLFDWLYIPHSVFYFFLLDQSSSSSLCMVFDSISSNIDEIFSINQSANVFVLGDFNVQHKDWPTYSGKTDRTGELCYNFSISNDLTQMINFPASIPDCDTATLTGLLFCIYLFLALVFVLQQLSLPWEILIMMLSQFPLNFHQTPNRMPYFIT